MPLGAVVVVLWLPSAAVANTVTPDSGAPPEAAVTVPEMVAPGCITASMFDTPEPERTLTPVASDFDAVPDVCPLYHCDA